MLMARKFGRSREGATVIEYALIAGLVSIAAVAIIGTLGGSLITLYSGVSSPVSSAAANMPTPPG
jgi:pilus assembly protein Flp/PilA